MTPQHQLQNGPGGVEPVQGRADQRCGNHLPQPAEPLGRPAGHGGQRSTPGGSHHDQAAPVTRPFSGQAQGDGGAVAGGHHGDRTWVGGAQERKNGPEHGTQQGGVVRDGRAIAVAEARPVNTHELALITNGVGQGLPLAAAGDGAQRRQQQPEWCRSGPGTLQHNPQPVSGQIQLQPFHGSPRAGVMRTPAFSIQPVGPAS